jgi:drug/metabolite transporter (DMT)-like permease
MAPGEREAGAVSPRTRHTLRSDVIRLLDSNAALLALLILNFFVLSLIDDRGTGAFVSTLIAALALTVAISDPAAGRTLSRTQAIAIAAVVVAASAVFFVDWQPLVGWTYLLPAIAMVTITLPVTIARTLQHPRVTHETILGALCAYVLVGLVFAFVYLALHDLAHTDFFAQPGPHPQSEYLYFSFVVLTTLGFGDLSPSVGLPQALVALEALVGQVFLVTMVARLVTLWVRRQDEVVGRI